MTTETERFAQFEFLGLASQEPYLTRLTQVIEIIHLFEDFTRDDLIGLAGQMYCFRAPAGSQIIYEGEEGDFMLLLLEGTVEIVKLDETNTPRQVGKAAAGDAIGEMSLIDGEPRSASCLAQTPILFTILDRERLNRILVDEPKLGVKVLASLAIRLNQRLRKANARWVKTLEEIAWYSQDNLSGI